MITFKMLMTNALVMCITFNRHCSADLIQRCENLISTSFHSEFGISVSKQNGSQYFATFYKQFTLNQMAQLKPETSSGFFHSDIHIRNVKRKLLSDYMEKIYDLENINSYLTFTGVLPPRSWCETQALEVMKNKEYKESPYVFISHEEPGSLIRACLDALHRVSIDVTSTDLKSVFKAFYESWTSATLNFGIVYGTPESSQGLTNDDMKNMFFTSKFLDEYYRLINAKIDNINTHNWQYIHYPDVRVKCLSTEEYCKQHGYEIIINSPLLYV